MLFVIIIFDILKLYFINIERYLLLSYGISSQQNVFEGLVDYKITCKTIDLAYFQY